jgi:hypothetical protein
VAIGRTRGGKKRSDRAERPQQAHEDGALTCAYARQTNPVTGAVDETHANAGRVQRMGCSINTRTQACGHTLGSSVAAADGTYAASSALTALSGLVWSWQIIREVVLESLPTEVWSIALGPAGEMW